ncbi:hypothetical protein D9M71_444550 [compost metagenome]
MQGRFHAKVQAIEQVVAGDDDRAHGDQGGSWQPDQQRQGDHADADGPDHLQVDHAGWQLEGPGEVDQGELQHHQEQPAFEQERRDVATALMLLAIQPGRQAGQQDEHRRTQVSEGAAEEKRRFRGVDGHGVADLAVQEESLADVVQEHEQDHQAAQGIDALQALGDQRGRGAGTCHGLSNRNEFHVKRYRITRR